MQNLRSWFAARKGYANPEDLTDWNLLAMLGLVTCLAGRIVRGILCRVLMGRTEGMVLCERRVRLHHASHIRTGRGLNLEEGCEIVGLSKRGITFGEHCTVGRFATIRPTNVLLAEAGEGLRMGDNSNIGPYSYIGCSGYTEIGASVMMGPRVSLLAENHNFDRDDCPIRDQGVTRGFIRIEDNCWIGAGATILPNVTIGKGAVVAAGAVVTHDVPHDSVVGGVPAKIIRSRGSSTTAQQPSP